MVHWSGSLVLTVMVLMSTIESAAVQISFRKYTFLGTYSGTVENY